MITHETYRGTVLTDIGTTAAFLPLEARHIDTYTSGTFVAILYDARQYRLGTVITFAQHGAGRLIIFDQAVNLLQSTSSATGGIILIDNSTEAGVWLLKPTTASLNTPRVVHTNRSTIPAAASSDAPLSISCPRYFELIDCVDPTVAYLTDSDLSSYIGMVVISDEVPACSKVSVWDGPEPDAEDLTVITVIDSTSLCGESLCQPCGLWGALDDFAESGSGPVIPSYSEGFWSVVINRNTGAAKTVTASVPPCPLDLSDIEAFVLSFDYVSSSEDHVLELVLFGDSGSVHTLELSLNPGFIAGSCPTASTAVSIRLERDGVNPEQWIVASGAIMADCPSHEVSAASVIRTDMPGDGPGFDFDEWRIQIDAYCEISCSSDNSLLTISNLQLCWELVEP